MRAAEVRARKASAYPGATRVFVFFSPPACFPLLLLLTERLWCWDVNRGHFQIVSDRDVERAQRQPVADNVQAFLQRRLENGKRRAPLHLIGKGTGRNTLALESFGNVQATSRQVREMRKKFGVVQQRRH